MYIIAIDRAEDQIKLTSTIILSFFTLFPQLHQWSFGITCWEVFSGGKMPYPTIPPPSLLSFLQKGHRLEKPKNAACSDEM